MGDVEPQVQEGSSLFPLHEDPGDDDDDGDQPKSREAFRGSHL